MSSIVKAGSALGLLVAAWMFVYGFTGLYKNPDLAWLFPVVATLIQIGVLVWGLKMTAAEGRRYGGQIVAGLLICLVGAVIIFVASMFWSTAVFTDVFEVSAGMQADAWADQGMTEDEIENMLVATEFTRTPFFQAFLGAIMTLLTGLVISLITAAFLRQKD